MMFTTQALKWKYVPFGSLLYNGILLTYKISYTILVDKYIIIRLEKTPLIGGFVIYTSNCLSIGIIRERWIKYY
jgi:hypothetical protein